MEALSGLRHFLCTECGGKILIWDSGSGEVTCRRCGLVLKETAINTGQEYSVYNYSEWERRSRVGSPGFYSVYDMGLATVIGPISRDAQGRSIPMVKRIKMSRLKRHQRRSRLDSQVQRSLAYAMNVIENLTEKLHTPKNVKENAAIIYRKALKKRLIQGRSISSIAAASLYAACRITRTPRTLREISEICTIEKMDLARCYRFLLKELKLHMPAPRTFYMMPKIASKIGVKEKTRHKAIEILREAEHIKATAGKNPKGLVAAALYIACLMNHEKKTQEAIADASEVTAVTIRNRYKELKEALNLNL